MLTKIRKIFMDYEKEEKWLNEMSQNGLAFCAYKPFKYSFLSEEAGKYIYRIELLKTLPSKQESQDYFEFCKELNIEVVETSYRWVFFRKLASDGPFEIHSDLESKLKHHRRIKTLVSTVCIANFIIGFSNLMIGYVSRLNMYSSIISFTAALLLLRVAYSQHKKIEKLLEK